MKRVYYPRFERPAVYLINGAFVEKPDAVPYDDASPLYITVLPLSAVLLPYTVKLLKGEAAENKLLCDCYQIEPEHTLCLLKPRHNYVYAPPAAITPQEPSGAFERFFALVRRGDLIDARAYLSDDLNETLSDEALGEFFDGYEAVIENSFTASGGYLLLGKGESARCKVAVDVGGGRIVNITIE